MSAVLTAHFFILKNVSAPKEADVLDLGPMVVATEVWWSNFTGFVVGVFFFKSSHCSGKGFRFSGTFSGSSLCSSVVYILCYVL